MALPQNPYAEYKNSGIFTASPGELVLKLYDGMIRYTNLAKVSIEQKEIASAHENIIKAERIIDHLLATLDRKYEVSQEFDVLYSDLLNALIKANVNKDVELLDEILEKMRMIRDNWKDVMKKSIEDSNMSPAQ